MKRDLILTVCIRLRIIDVGIPGIDQDRPERVPARTADQHDQARDHDKNGSFRRLSLFLEM